MKKEDFYDTKIKIEDIEERKLFLDYLKTLGYNIWDTLYKANELYIYSGSVSFMYNNSDYFEKHSNKEIFLKDIPYKIKQKKQVKQYYSFKDLE